MDHLYIQVANPSSDPPDGGPTGLGASAVSPSQINLAWTDGAGNESGYRVERSANGTSGWSVVAELPVNSQAFSNTGLAANTTYFYRVSAYNSNGSSAYASANATTPAAPPPPALDLTATGFRAKGVASVSLELDRRQQRGCLPKWRRHRRGRGRQCVHGQYRHQGRGHLHAQGLRGRQQHHLFEHDDDGVLKECGARAGQAVALAWRAASWMKPSTASMPLLRVGDRCLPSPISAT